MLAMQLSMRGIPVKPAEQKRKVTNSQSESCKMQRKTTPLLFVLLAKVAVTARRSMARTLTYADMGVNWVIPFSTASN